MFVFDFIFLIGVIRFYPTPPCSLFVTSVAHLRYSIREVFHLKLFIRGAPAIAIAAVLSLAVEVSTLDVFNGSLADATSFLSNKLDYLVSSRPTAVNLSDAATKLKEIIVKAASSASETNVVFQAYIEAAELMLEDDVASNKAIGSYGASFIVHHLKDSKKVSILSHCNTGSLATAGYGTALGVIRSLHADGLLQSAYCTETRPFNQWSSKTRRTYKREELDVVR